MEAVDYIKNPCRASSLPFWKAESMIIPAHLKVIRDDEFLLEKYSGIDEPYFKLIHNLNDIRSYSLCGRFKNVNCGNKVLAAHIRECYKEEAISEEELDTYREHPVYNESLWVAVEDTECDRIVASGIGELDTRIGEGILEWIQVSPDYRHRGFGRFLVFELLCRMQNRARFVTVSGRLKNESNPFALYKACGFTDPVIWHVIRC